MSERSPPLNCKLTLIAMQGHRTKRKNKTETVRSKHWVNSIMSERSPPLYCTLTLITMQGQQTKSKNKTQTVRSSTSIINQGSSSNILFHRLQRQTRTYPLRATSSKSTQQTGVPRNVEQEYHCCSVFMVQRDVTGAKQLMVQIPHRAKMNAPLWRSYFVQ